jgi:hypothetical protein
MYEEVTGGGAVKGCIRGIAILSSSSGNVKFAQN